MLLRDENQFNWYEARKLALDEFARKIDFCIENLQWENLATILDSRQQFLEQLSLEAIPENFRFAIKQLIQSVLQQDELYQAKIQRQKDIASQQQVEIERGRRAINAYTSQ